MATAKQIQARKRFKEVAAEAKKLRAKNPKLSQAQAVKQAWAIEYSVAGKTKTKKQVRSKVGEMRMSSDNLERMDDLVYISELRKLVDATKIIAKDFIEEGFEDYEIKEYLNIIVSRTIKDIL
jgi:hypothetical protein